MAAENLVSEMVLANHRFRKTASVSTSTRSGAATSPAKRSSWRARSPSNPSSPTAFAKTDASMTITAGRVPQRGPERPDPSRLGRWRAACTSSGMSRTRTFGMLALCYHPWRIASATPASISHPLVAPAGIPDLPPGVRPVALDMFSIGAPFCLTRCPKTTAQRWCRSPEQATPNRYATLSTGNSTPTTSPRSRLGFSPCVQR
jgi:hypothetical protein